MISAASSSAASIASWARSAASASMFSEDLPASSRMLATWLPRWLKDGAPEVSICAR
jgi:hypothetical protein